MPKFRRNHHQEVMKYKKFITKMQKINIKNKSNTKKKKYQKVNQTSKKVQAKYFCRKKTIKIPIYLNITQKTIIKQKIISILDLFKHQTKETKMKWNMVIMKKMEIMMKVKYTINMIN